MNEPIDEGKLKIVQGQSGRGLQIECVCGTVNWNHVEATIALWVCRNCGRILSSDFPRLAARFFAAHPEAVPAPTPAKPSPPKPSPS